MDRKCFKCRAVKQNATGGVAEECPGCGAIFSKVEAAVESRRRAAAGLDTRLPDADQVAAPASRSSGGYESIKTDAEVDFELYVEKMRARSLYPTFRGLTALLYGLFVALAVLCAVGGVVGLVFGSGSGKVGGFLGGLFFALVFLVIGRVVKEASLMLADLSDAAVRTAASVPSRR